MVHCKAAAEQHAPGKWTIMPSGAGHDAQRIAEVMPSAMLFVPSINGLSHNFDEDTVESDLILGAQVYTDAAARMLLAAHDQRASAGGWKRRVATHDPWRPRPQPVSARSTIPRLGPGVPRGVVGRPSSVASISNHSELISEDSSTLAAVESALVVPAVRELLESEIGFAVAALGTPEADGSLPVKYSKEFAVPPSMIDIFPQEVGTIRIFGLQVSHPHCVDSHARHLMLLVVSGGSSDERIRATPKFGPAHKSSSRRGNMACASPGWFVVSRHDHCRAIGCNCISNDRECEAQWTPQPHACCSGARRLSPN